MEQVYVRRAGLRGSPRQRMRLCLDAPCWLGLRLHLVRKGERPLAKLNTAEKLARAKAYLRERGKYILDRNTPRPPLGRTGVG